MDVSYIQLVKIDHDNNNVVVEPIDEQENIKQYVKDRHNIGTKKELSEIDRVKWDTEKLKNDTNANIKAKTDKTKRFIRRTKNNIINKTKKTTKNWL